MTNILLPEEIQQFFIRTQDEVDLHQGRVKDFQNQQPIDLSISDVYKRMGELTPYVDAWRTYTQLLENLKQIQQMMDGDDAELMLLVAEELDECKSKLDAHIASMVELAKGEESKGGVIIEIRAGTGGDEAGLFARDLLRAYRLFCEQIGAKCILESWQDNNLDGLRVGVISVEDDQAQKWFLGEAGVHRVQRVPETESSGRIHTSTISVAAFPVFNKDDKEVVLDKKELRVDTYRSSGAGGQHVNKTDSAVRITHLPTKVSAECQQERSQHQNRARAMMMLQAKLQMLLREQAMEQETEERRTMIGGSTRAEKIRTYNYMQLRVTDHRVGKSWYNLEQIMNGQMLDIFENVAAWADREMIKNKTL